MSAEFLGRAEEKPRGVLEHSRNEAMNKPYNTNKHTWKPYNTVR